MPTATPTLAELATIAHPPMFGCRRPPSTSAPRPTPRARFRFSAFVSGRRSRQWRPIPLDHRAIVVAVNRSGEAIAYDPTTDRIDSDIRPSHRTRSRTPHTRARHSALPAPGVGTRKPRLARSRSRRRAGAAARRTTPLAQAAPPHPWPKRGHRRVRKCLLITRHQPTTWAVLRTGSDRRHDHLDTDSSGAGLVVRRGVVRSSLLCVAARSRHRRG